MNPSTPAWLDLNEVPSLAKTLSDVKTHADISPKSIQASLSGAMGGHSDPNNANLDGTMRFSGSLAPKIDDINKGRKAFVKKSKPDYRLYPIYEQLVGMLATCKPTLDELFYYGDKGTPQEKVLFHSPTAIHFASIDDDHKLLVDEIYNIYNDVKDKPNQCRDDWVREKVDQTRYTNKGREYASRLEEIGNAIFSLSALVADFQNRLYQALATSGEFDEK